MKSLDKVEQLYNIWLSTILFSRRTNMAVTKAKIADPIVLLVGYGGHTKAMLLSGVVGLSVVDAANLASNIGDILSPSYLLPTSDLAHFTSAGRPVRMAQSRL
jgi:hypothetical protein